MCFQVSDVTVTSGQIRRTVLGHAVLSFAYNTVILAFTLNLVFRVAELTGSVRERGGGRTLEGRQ